MIRKCVGILVLISACSRGGVTRPARSVESPYRRTIVDRTPGTARLAETPILDAPAIIDQINRIRPDRRFVNAAADIVEISTRKPVDLLEIEFSNGQWQVRVDRKNAVAFPELVTFHDALDALTRSVPPAAATTTQTPESIRSIDSDIASFYPRFLFSALHKLDAAGGLDAEIAPRAARAATLLALQTRDTFDFADPLRGRALALLAIAKSRDAKCCADTEALLSGQMGYRNEAEDLAAALSPGFSRSWQLNEPADPARSTADAYLVLTRKFNSTDIIGDEPFTATIDVEAGQLILENMNRGSAWPFGVVSQGLLLRSMANPKETKFVFDADGRWQKEFGRATSSTFLSEYEQKAEPFAKTRATSLVDTRDVRSYYDANFYSAVEQPFEQFYSYFGDAPGATRYAASLHPRTANGTNAASWMANLVDARYGQFTNDRIGSAMASVSLIGGRARYSLFEWIQATVGSTAELRDAGQNMLTTLDSRPNETLSASHLEAYPIGDAARRDQYMHAALDRARTAFAGQRASMLLSIGDLEGLRKLAENQKALRWDRIEALCSMSDLVNTDLHVQWEALIAADGYKTGYTTCYWDYLERRKESKRKIEFAKAILSHRPNIDSIARSNIVADIGDGLEAEGQYAPAWQLIEPEIPVYSGSILITATSLLQRLGRNQESLELGHQMVKRYPSALTRAYFAPVLWRMKRFDEAAELFDPTKQTYALAEAQHHLAKVLLRSFDDSQIPDALRAFDALGNAHASGLLLEEIVKAAFREKRFRLAFELDQHFLAARLAGADADAQMRCYGIGYKAVKELQGHDAALQWFIDKMGRGAGFNVLQALFMNGDFELLTRYSETRPPSSKPVETASMLASALSLQRVPHSDPQWATVRSMIPAHVEPDETTIASSVRYLLGETDIANVAKTVNSPNRRAESAYFLAADAVGKHDYERARLFLLVACEGPPTYAPRNWAVGQLYRWIGDQETWDDISRRGLI